MDRFDVLIVGAGFSGLVLAERLSSQLGKKCLVVDRREHIGGNAHDYYDAAGVLIHPYGPHYFRTNSQRVVDYLSQFTQWHPVVYRVQSYTDGRYWSFPINLTTFEQWVGRESSTEEFEAYLKDKRVPIDDPKNSEEVVVAQVGWELYEKFFLGYTLKHWKRHPRDLDASVCGRIPIRTTRNDGYLREKFQALPKEGYSSLFEAMVAASPGIEIRLETDFRTVRDKVHYDHMVYTGAIDAFFDNAYGQLAYRSLRFEHESFSKETLVTREPISNKKGFWQPGMQVNYPNDHDFTRIVEIKHATGQTCESTTIVKEFAAEFEDTNEAYYPVPSNASKELYQRYAKLASRESNVSFVGRLANYRYYNMDQVVAMALTQFDELAARFRRD